MKPITKEDIKREVDQLPESVLTRLHSFIASLNNRTKKSGKFPTYNLKGKFDDLDVRLEAYNPLVNN